MTESYSTRVLLVLQVCLTIAISTSKGAIIDGSACEVKARTDAGWVCGKQQTYDNHTFASFLNVPYSRQPVGSLRFQELQPAEPWDGYYDATTEGPICPQSDVLYGRLMTNTNSSEACIHANIYVPIEALPSSACSSSDEGLPILVFIHGGGFSSGSGDQDVNGPEYLVKEGLIVVTFNYRINVFGFLSLNSSFIPGNNGIRDALTLLKWVKRNAMLFGGNPNDVTLAGHSSGAANVHLLTLSESSTGLFHRAILLSGSGIRSFYTTSPTYANTLAQLLLSYLGITSTDAEEIHQQLTAVPLETLMNATYKIQATYGFIYFTPVIETKSANFTTIIDEDPEVLLRKGRGKNIPLIIGFTNMEGKVFVPFYTEIGILAALPTNPLYVQSPDITYRLSSAQGVAVANETLNKCFNGTPTVDKFTKCFTDNCIVYPATKIAQIRASMHNSAPVFLYQYSYNASFSPIKVTKKISYDGATHIDDLMFYFRTNSMKNEIGFDPPSTRDGEMRTQMASYIKNFISCNNPLCSNGDSSAWPAETAQAIKYENIVDPSNIYYTGLTDAQADTVCYYDQIYDEIYNTTS